MADKTDLMEEKEMDLFEYVSELMLRYDIGKKSLAKLLGRSEGIFFTYEKRNIQNSPILTELEMIYNRPGKYLELLNKKRNEISPRSYRKSYDAFKRYLIRDRMDEVMQFIIDALIGDVQEGWLQGCLYFSQVVMLCWGGREIMEEKCGYDDKLLYYERIRAEFSIRKEVILNNETYSLTMDEKKVIYTVMDVFSWFSYRTVDNLMKEEKNRYARPGSTMTISNSEILLHYRHVFERERLFSLENIESYLYSRLKKQIGSERQ